MLKIWMDGKLVPKDEAKVSVSGGLGLDQTDLRAAEQAMGFEEPHEAGEPVSPEGVARPEVVLCDASVIDDGYAIHGTGLSPLGYLGLRFGIIWPCRGSP